VVPEDLALFDNLTAREYLTFIGRMYQLPLATVRERSEELLTMMSLDHEEKKLTLEYSHGMKQRVVMASAFLHNPSVIMIDEPMVGLDPGGVKLVNSVLQEFAATGGTVFLSTHTLSVAEEVCERIGIIKSGRLIALGSQNDIVEKDVRLEDFFLALTSEPLE